MTHLSNLVSRLRQLSNAVDELPSGEVNTSKEGEFHTLVRSDELVDLHHTNKIVKELLKGYTPEVLPTDSNYQFESQCYAGQKLFAYKNKNYDGAFRKYGLLGVVMEIMGVLSRIPPMTFWKASEEPMNIEKLRDLFMDLHNFSNMALMVLEDNNWDGKHPIVPSGVHKAIYEKEVNHDI
jgi:hypothetical protein